MLWNSHNPRSHHLCSTYADGRRQTFNLSHVCSCYMLFLSILYSLVDRLLYNQLSFCVDSHVIWGLSTTVLSVWKASPALLRFLITSSQLPPLITPTPWNSSLFLRSPKSATEKVLVCCSNPPQERLGNVWRTDMRYLQHHKCLCTGLFCPLFSSNPNN